MKKLSCAIAACLLGLPLAAAAGDFNLSSPDVGPKAPITNKFVFKGFGCEGENVSPALAWQGAPKGTRASLSPSTTRMRRPAAAGGTG
jgi:phosphatidylethanolamine-binding protein (PEBP) family uncharacterized protein